MKRLIRMPSIQQFRDAIHKIEQITRFEKLDENGNPVYNNNLLPCLNSTGTDLKI